MSYLIAFILMPVMSLIFILIAHNMQRSAFGNLKDLYKKALILIIPFFAVIGVFGMIGLDAMKPVGLPEIATIGLVAASLHCLSIPPNLKNKLQC